MCMPMALGWVGVSTFLNHNSVYLSDLIFKPSLLPLSPVYLSMNNNIF